METETITCDCRRCNGASITAPSDFLLTFSARDRLIATHNYVSMMHSASLIGRILASRNGLRKA